MDVAKHLAQWQEQSPEQWVRAANRYLPTAVTFILVVAIAYQLSRLTWAVVPGRSAGRRAVPEPRVERPGRHGTVIELRHARDRALVR